MSQHGSARAFYCRRCERTYRVTHWTGEQVLLCEICSSKLTLPPADAEYDARALSEIESDSRENEGEAFGRYRLLEELGRGGMGVVWKAWDRQLKRIVALKKVLNESSASPSEIERFLREARSAARLRHPNIVTVHDVGLVDGQHFLTADYIEGRPLDVVARESMPPKKAVELIHKIASALHSAHKEGIVHRDIKPGNILIDDQNEPHIMDFGLAKDVKKGHESSLTISGDVIGTPHYMSPEQADGRVEDITATSDQFSLAAVLYELLTGQRPFEAKSVREILNAVIENEPVRPGRINPRIHQDVETICLKALEKDPSRRYADMESFAGDLTRYLEGEPISASPDTGLSRLWRRFMKHRAIVIPSVAAIVLALILGGYVALDTTRRAERIRTLLEDARRFEAEDHMEKARAAFQSILDLDAKHAEATAGFTRTDTIHRRNQEASREQIRQAALRNEAFQLLEKGRPAIDKADRLRYAEDVSPSELSARVDEGQARIEQALAKVPDLAAAHHLMGRAWHIKGWWDRAETSWRKAIELDPGFASARFELGRLLFAKAYLQWSTELLEGKTSAVIANATAREGMKLIEEALSGQQTLDDELQRHIARCMVAYVQDRGDLQTLLDEGFQRFEKREGIEELHWLQGLGQDRETAVREYTRALRIRPGYVLALLLRATNYYWMGRPEKAVSDFDYALVMNPRLPELYHGRGLAYRKLNRNAEAILDFRASLELRDHFPAAWNNLGMSYAMDGEFEEAERCFGKSIRQQPKNATAFYNRGSMWARMNKLDDAILDLTSAIRIDPNHYLARAQRGGMHATKGDFREAVRDFTESLKAAPKDWPFRGNIEEMLRRAESELDDK